MVVGAGRCPSSACHLAYDRRASLVGRHGGPRKSTGGPKAVKDQSVLGNIGGPCTQTAVLQTTPSSSLSWLSLHPMLSASGRLWEAGLGYAAETALTAPEGNPLQSCDLVKRITVPSSWKCMGSWVSRPQCSSFGRPGRLPGACLC